MTRSNPYWYSSKMILWVGLQGSVMYKVRGRRPWLGTKTSTGNDRNFMEITRSKNYNCNECGYVFTFPRYGDILKIAKTRTDRCSEWSMLFGGIMNSLKAGTRIIHDFLDHCWNETLMDG